MSLSLPQQDPKTGQDGVASSKQLPKLRSCVMCRTRKVRCDKLSPCTNCRKGGIECVLPSLNRPPRWARRLEQNAATGAAAPDANANQVMGRLKSLEALVKDLNGKLEKANAAVAAATAGSSAGSFKQSPSSSNDKDEPSPGSTVSDVQNQMGRLVMGNGESRYISGDFWARINDELDGLQIDADILGQDGYSSSDDNDMPTAVPVTGELNRAAMDRNGFLFGTNLMPGHIIDTNRLHPLPSQIPFLFDVYSESFNSKSQLIHMPTLRKTVRDLPGGNLKHLKPAEEALMFAVYYTAITSMEEDNTALNFGASKSELNMKYRVGLEHALSKADFLGKPDITLVQALVSFLFIARRHDTPSYIWMMTGLAIRMGIALGLQRDGSQFPNLSPYDIEIRRRAWWNLVMLDMRSSEDLGVDFTIQTGSFDTQLPSNVNDADLFPGMKDTPEAKEGVTDTTAAIAWCGMCQVTKEMMALNPRPTQEEQYQFLNQYYERLNETYLQYENPEGNINYWLTLTVTRMVVSKMTLIIYLPLLFSSPNEQYDTFATDIQSRLFTSAIEVIEYNHSLNSEPAYRPWRWIFQTCTHWHAIIYLLLSVVRRPWSAMSERAWVALHSTWLFPAQSTEQKDHGVWIPLKKLMTKARRYRAAELSRLAHDPASSHQLALEEESMMQPKSKGPLPGEDSAAQFRQRWRQLLDKKCSSVVSSQQPNFTQNALFNPATASSTGSHISWDVFVDPSLSQTTLSSQVANVPLEWSDPPGPGMDFSTWLWTGDSHTNTNVDIMNTDFSLDTGADIQDSRETSEEAGDVDWNSWLATAKGMETQVI